MSRQPLLARFGFSSRPRLPSDPHPSEQNWRLANESRRLREQAARAAEIERSILASRPVHDQVALQLAQLPGALPDSFVKLTDKQYQEELLYRCYTNRVHHSANRDVKIRLQLLNVRLKRVTLPNGCKSISLEISHVAEPYLVVDSPRLQYAACVGYLPVCAYSTYSAALHTVCASSTYLISRVIQGCLSQHAKSFGLNEASASADAIISQTSPVSRIISDYFEAHANIWGANILEHYGTLLLLFQNCCGNVRVLSLL